MCAFGSYDRTPATSVYPKPTHHLALLPRPPTHQHNVCISVRTTGDTSHQLLGNRKPSTPTPTPSARSHRLHITVRACVCHVSGLVRAVSPVHIPPCCAVGVVLGEQMVKPRRLIVERAIWVIHPVLDGLVMESRVVRVAHVPRWCWWQ